MPDFDFKLITGTAAGLLSFVSYIPYIRGMVLRRNEPHPYSWLIWGITTTTVAFGVLIGGGGYGVIPVFAWAILSSTVFLLSLRYGTKNITTWDAVAFAAAFGAIVLWWQFHAPLPAMLALTLIDALAYLPTIRKSYEEPRSESLSAWTLFSLVPCFGLLALSEYTLLTTVYLLMSLAMNVFVMVICLSRRHAVPKPL